MKLLWRWLMVALIVLAVASLTVWLKNNDGGVKIEWLGYQIAAPFWLLTAVIMVLLCAAIITVWGVMRLMFWRKKSVMQKLAKNQQKGLSEVTMAISSLALGDVTDAAAHLRSTGKLLGHDNALYQLLDFHISAKEGRALPLEKLEQYSETKLLGLSAQANVALQQGEVAVALLAAKKAYEMRPDNVRICVQYFGLLLQNNEFVQATACLKKMRKLKLPNYNKLQAISCFLEFKHYPERTDLLQKAFEFAPDFAPAYEWIIAAKQDKWKLLHRAWLANPHPELVEIMLQYFTETSNKQVKKMADMHPASIETQWLLANVAMAGKAYDVARNHLKAALAISPQRRIYAMLAQLEEQSQGEKQAKIWLQKMANAALNPAWSCNNCEHIHTHWQLECEACHSFAAIEFGEQKLQHGKIMLFLN